LAGKILTAGAIALGSTSFITLFLVDTAGAQSVLPAVTVEAPKPRLARPVNQRAPVRVQAARPVPAPATPVDVRPLTISKDTEATENSNSYTATRAGVGSKSGAAIKDTPQSISVMTRTRMDQQNITSVEDAMRNTTGMTVLEADAGRSTVYSRGYALDTIQIDGVTSTANNFFSFPDLYFYDRVETLRGPNALFSGSGNPSGSINLVRKRALDIGQFQGSVSYGSFNAKRGEFDITGPLNEQRTVRARLAAAYDDKELFYKLPSGNPSFYKRPSIYGTVEADITEDTTLSFGTMYNSVDYTAFFGWPTYPNGTQLPVSRDAMYGADWNRWRSSTLDKFVELEHRFENGGRAKVTFRDSDRDSEGVYATPSSAINPLTGSGTMNRISIGPQMNNKTVDAFVTTPFELFGQTQNITVGTDWRKSDYLLQTGNAPGVTQNIFNPVALPYQDMPYVNRSNTVETQSGVYGQMRFKPLHWLTLIGGGRLSQWETSTLNLVNGARSGVANVENKLTANYGVVVDVTKQVALYASYADIFQPQTTQMFGGGVVPPRMGQQQEAGIKTSLLDGRINAHLAVFKINDVNRSLADPNNPGFALPAGEAESKGFETEVSGRILPGWDLTAGYAYTDTRYLRDSVTNEGQPFQTLTPAHSYNLWSRYLFEDGPLQGLSIAGGARIVSSFYTRSSGITVTQAGYQVLTAQLGYQFTPNIWATLTATNVLDQNYYSYVNTTTTGNRFGEPRSIILKLSSRW
jgi:outer membrane receptor for ferric coprogen and ferric-rhodotorulic acid